MSQQLTQVGTFRGRIKSYALNSAKSTSAKAVHLLIAIKEIYENNEWMNWEEYDVEVDGDVWIIKKDGSLNDTQVQSLMSYADWDGDLLSIVNGSWKPTDVQVTVQADTYNDNLRYRISYLYEYDSIPGDGKVSLESAQSLQEQYGPQLRALAGNDRRNTKMSAGKPVKVENPTGATKPKTQPIADGDIPF